MWAVACGCSSPSATKKSPEAARSDAGGAEEKWRPPPGAVGEEASEDGRVE